jgi:hypothetical protein
VERRRSGDRRPVAFKLGRCPGHRLRNLERLLAAHHQDCLFTANVRGAPAFRLRIPREDARPLV